MALSKQATDAASAVAAAAAEADAAPVDEKEVGHTDAGGQMISPEMFSRAKRLPEKDEVQKNVKAAMLAKTTAAEHKAKVKVVKASPDAEETPSGAALVASESIADENKRAAAYRSVKAAMRHGVIGV